MKMVLIAFLSLFVSQTFATTLLTISCNVETQSERVYEITNPKISFDAEKEYKNLTFEVYGAKIIVAATSANAAGNGQSFHVLQGICVGRSANGVLFCADKPEVTMFPKNRQSGDKTKISCALKAGE